MAELGFVSTELGSAGWLPETSPELNEALARHGLQLLAAFVPLVLHDPAQADAALDHAARIAMLLDACGAKYFNTAPVTSDSWEARRAYSNAEWDHLAELISEVELICETHGLVQVVHEHVGCVIETVDDIERLLACSPVKFVLDTGHMQVAGCDPLEFARQHSDRVGLVHLKDTRLAVAAQLAAGEVTLMQAVQDGLFPALGRGDLPIDAIVLALEQRGFDGHYVIEQDCAIVGALPPPGSGPIRDVATSLEYLRNVAAVSDAFVDGSSIS